MLGDDGRAVLLHLGDGKSRVAAIGHLLEPGVVAARRLGAALDDVPGHYGPRQAVEVLGLPGVPPGSRPHHQGCVGHAATDHDVGARGKCLCDAEAAKVGVGGDRLDARIGQGLAGVEIGERVPFGDQVHNPVRYIVAIHPRDLGAQPQALTQGGDLGRKAGGIEAARVGYDLDSTLQAGAQHLLHLREEGARIAGGGILQPRLPEDEHGQLGQVIPGQHIDGATLDHLARCRQPVAVKAGAVGDPYGKFDGHRPHLSFSGKLPASLPGPGAPA